MAKSAKTRKPMSARSKGIICLILLLALTVFVSCLAVGGMKLDSEGVNVLLPWLPVSSANWPQSLPVTRALGGGTYTEFTAALPAGAEEGASLDTLAGEAVKVINNRLENMGEQDRTVTLQDGGKIRVELRNMDASRLSSVMSMATMRGQFEFRGTDGTVILTGKEIARGVLGYNSTRTGYTLTLTPTQEGAQALTDAGVGVVSVYCDGSAVTSAATVSGGTISIQMGTDYTTGANLAFLLNTGALDVTLAQGESGDIPASAGGTLRVVLIAAAVLLLAALVYLVITGKLTGVSGIWTVWCAVLLGLFFYATIVIPSIVASTAPCLIALLLGILLAIFTAVTRTDAISKQISEGYGPKQATKLGFRAAGKLVWLVHGGALVLSLILMIFSFSKATGYSLCAGVVASAIAAPLMRLFQACFTSITGKASLFGKVK